MKIIKLNTFGLNAVSLNRVGLRKANKTSVIVDRYEDFFATAANMLTISNMKQDSISSLLMYGGCTQKGTPSPSNPIDITSNVGSVKYERLSNNMLNVKDSNIVLGKYLNNSGEEVSSSANFYINHCIPVKANTVYTASFSTAIGYFSFMEYDKDLVFIKRTLVGGGTSSRITSVNHTMGENTAYVVVGSNPTSAQVTKDYVLSIEWMFNEGSSALPYDDYREGLHITDFDSMRIGSKNLNEGVLEQKGYTSTGGVSSSTTFCGSLCKIKVREGQKYTVSFGDFPDGASGVFVNTWLTDGTWNMRQAISSTGKLTYTIPAGVGEVNFTLYKTGGITIGPDSWLQVELGSEVTSYEPYALYSEAFAEMLLSVGDNVDTQDLVTGVVTRNVGIKVFDGSERISLSSGTFNFGVEDKLKKGTTIWCSHYPYTSASASTAADKTIKSYSSVNIGFKDADYATTEEFEEFLRLQYVKGTPVIVVYPLAEPITETVEPVVLKNDAGNVTFIRNTSVSSLQFDVACQVKEEEQNKLIKFYLQRCPLKGGELEEYTAEEGMTWVEFCRSDYNTDEWYAYNQDEGEADDYVETFYTSQGIGWDALEEWGWITSDENIWVDGRETYKDVIIPNHIYYEQSDQYGGIGGGGI